VYCTIIRTHPVRYVPCSYCYKAVELRTGEIKTHCQYDNNIIALLAGDDYERAVRPNL